MNVLVPVDKKLSMNSASFLQVGHDQIIGMDCRSFCLQLAAVCVLVS